MSSFSNEKKMRGHYLKCLIVDIYLKFILGATLCKGLNRGIGTLLAGSLAFLIQYIAQESCHVFRAIFIATTVFFIGIYI